MKDYSVDTLMEKTKNKYVLSQVISKRARDIRAEDNLFLGYKAIDQAAMELMNDKFSYSFDREKEHTDDE